MPLSLRDLRPEPSAGFRDASLADAELLYHWRRQAECEPHVVSHTRYEEHVDWLEARITDPLVRVWIWMEDGEPCGMVRVDSNGELAFHTEPSCDAVEMLRQAHTLAADYGGRLKASVDQADRVKIALLQEAGFDLFPVKFLAYRP